MADKSRLFIKETQVKTMGRVAPKQQAVSNYPSSSPIEQVLFLQRTLGNQAVQRFFTTGTIRPKLTCSFSNDSSCKNEELIQTKKVGNLTPEVTPVISSSIQSLKGSGQPLSGGERRFFEPRFGTNFSHVRVHNDTWAAGAARLVGARAFTFGDNVVFGSGEYCPDTSSGRRLLGHELTHVVQQQAGQPFRHSRTKDSGYQVVSRRIAPTPFNSRMAIFAKARTPGAVSPTSSLALDIIRGSVPLNLVFYRADVLSNYPDVQKHAERLAAEIKSPRIPPQWALGGCPKNVSGLVLTAGATKIQTDILPWVKGASNCLNSKKVSELHLFGELADGLDMSSSPGPMLKQYVSPNVRLFFHGCLVAQFFRGGISALLQDLGRAAKIFAHLEAGEPGRPVGFVEITLPQGRTTLSEKFIDDYTKVLPKKYIWAWARNEKTRELYSWLRGRRDSRLARDVRKIVISVLTKRLGREIRKWSLARLRRRLSRPIYDWEKRVIDKRIAELISRGP